MRKLKFFVSGLILVGMAGMVLPAQAESDCLTVLNLGKRIDHREFRIINVCPHDITAFWCTEGSEDDHWACGTGSYENGLKQFVGTTILHSGRSYTMETQGTSVVADACLGAFFPEQVEQYADVVDDELVCN